MSMLDPQQAWRRIAASLEPLPAAEEPAASCTGRVLAHPVIARADLPPGDVSAMDGYAFSGEVSAGDRLPVVGTIAAGHPATFELAPGAACRIMTGAVLPAGADRVVPVEQTDGGLTQVEVGAAPARGDHIRRRAEVIASGEPLLPPGARLTPAAIALLAAHGYQSVGVVRTPQVAVLTTGDEVVPPGSEPGPGQLRDSNTAFLLAAGSTIGLRFESLGIAPDERDTLRRRIASGLERDVLLLCGGVSMGEHDLVEAALGDLGCETLFDKVAMQPGKPLVAARHDGGWVFGLPGNPASVMVAFWLFVRPTLRCLLGIEDAFWQGALTAKLAAPIRGSEGRDRFVAASLRISAGQLTATPHPPKGSHDLLAYADGAALLRIPAGSPPREAGERCEVLPTSHAP